MNWILVVWMFTQPEVPYWTGQTPGFTSLKECQGVADAMQGGKRKDFLRAVCIPEKRQVLHLENPIFFNSGTVPAGGP